MISTGKIIGCFATLILSASIAAAAPLTFHVTVDTAALIGQASAPFSLDFQLTNGSPTSATTVTVSDFVFTGSGSGPSGTPTLVGGAAGALSSTVTLTDSSFLNEFFQPFTVGSVLQFLVTLTPTGSPGPTPDAFAFGILDNNLFNIPTSGIGDALLLVNVSTTALRASDVLTYRSTQPSGVGVTASLVPEPTSVVLLGTGVLIGALRRRSTAGRSKAVADRQTAGGSRR